MLEVINAPRAVPEALARLGNASILSRVWSHDHTVWQPDDADITNRLGWLDLPGAMPELIDRVERFIAGTRHEELRHVLLLGMGGSSLAPETFSKVFDRSEDHLDLSILDSTHPDAILDVESRLDLNRTLFIVATKSGTTTDPL